MWIIIITLCNCITLVMALAFCLCWKKKNPKNDLLGLDGMVTQKNPDENVNHLPSAAPPDSTSLTSSADQVDASKRGTLVTNPRRSLPDIPSEGLQEVVVSWEPTGDNTSDLYASVEQYQSSAKRAVIANGIDVRPSLSQHSSISQGDESFSPYARVNYDKLNKQEHPYARLQNIVNSRLEEDGEEDSSTRLLRAENRSPSQSVGEPMAPPRSRRASSHSGGHVDIPAASAVAGGIAASQELPYMTPPVAQTNFSGDSQDSSKGYTSITVREPLANIIAQTKEMNKLKREQDPHYSTVSDDSDDVYTTIPDPNIASSMSGSETYARITNHTVEALVNPMPVADDDDVGDGLYEPAPQPPPPGGLRQGPVRTHSRQASSSSSITNLGSPKPEKRQANSPLPPPPPSASPDLPTLHTVKNLDDMYAKVHKKRREVHSVGDGDARTVNTPVEDKKPAIGISEIDGKPLRREHNYETLKKSPRKCSDPGYEKIKPADCGSEPGYASINGPDSILSTDPGYEVLKQKAEVDPNYEELRHGSSSECNGYTRIKKVDETLIDGYSVVNKQRSNEGKSSSSYESDNTRDFDEPNYESMPSECDPNYAALKSTDSESDPNYESVLTLDPPYERLSDDSSKTDSDLPGYEKIKVNAGYETIANSVEPPYEQLNLDAGNVSGAVPDYETIKRRSALEESDDEGIIQV